MKALLLTALFGFVAQAHAAPVKIEFVYRDDTSVDDGRLFQLQGERNHTSLLEMCGESGGKCFCEFYSNTRRAVATDPVISMSSQSNQASCELSAGIDPDDVRFVRLRRAGNSRKYSDLVQVKTSLHLQDILGKKLPTEKVRSIFRYQCEKTFFEGEGVLGTSGSINCVAGQALGLITARYNYYLFDSPLGGNRSSEFGGDTAFDGAICGFNKALKTSCSTSVPDLRYALYGEYNEPFVVQVMLTAKPSFDIKTPTTGFAALPDANGNCPIGLMKIRPFQAVPHSIGPGMTLPTDLPSNFINGSGWLSDTVVESSDVIPNNFSVYRNPNTGAVYPNGRCSTNATTNPPYLCDEIRLSGAKPVQVVEYASLNPVVCAIPKHLIP